MQENGVWLTVNIGVYNGEKYISECLDSILNSKVRFNYEVVVIDDGSVDNTLQIIKAYEERDPKHIRVFTKENRGQGSTYNLGIDKANGKYILFADCDDMLVMEEIGRIFELSEHYDKDYDIILHNSIIVYSKDNELLKSDIQIHGWNGQIVKQPIAEGEYRFVEIWDKCNRLIHNNIFLTNFLRENRIFADEIYKYGADAILEVKASAYAQTVLCTHCVAYGYRVSEDQITNIRKLNRLYEDRLQLLTSAVNYYDTMINSCENSELRYKIIKTCICNISGLAYIAALYSDNIYKSIKRVNAIMSYNLDIWNSMNIKLVIIRSNIVLFYPVLKALVKARYRSYKRSKKFCLFRILRNND